MSSVLPLDGIEIPLPPPQTEELFAGIKYGSPYYHSEPHTNNDTLKCTLCWKYFCAICNNGTNRFAPNCLYCKN